VSDDYCLVGLDGKQPIAASLYNSAKVDFRNGGARLQHLKPFMIAREEMHEQKEVMFVNQHFPETVASTLPIRAILVPTITGEIDTRIVKTHAEEAARALIPSTMSQLPGSEIDSFFGMMTLTRVLPVYRLELGTDVEQIPATIAALINDEATKHDATASVLSGNDSQLIRDKTIETEVHAREMHAFSHPPGSST
jgi:hypothetical protein